MNENDDVMSFNEEPDLPPSDYEEPDLPETESEPAPSDSSYGEDMYKGYEGFEAIGAEDLPEGDFNAGSYTDDNNAEQSSEDSSEESQAKKILDTNPSEKTSPNNKNNGVFFNRQRILLVIAGVFVAFILFFTFVFPSISQKKRKEKEKELEKNSKQYIPSYIEQEIEEPARRFENTNSAMEEKEEPYEEKYPPVIEEKHENVAPVTINKAQTNNTSDVPVTNRNEQQKQPQRLSLDKTTSPVEKEREKYANGKYATVKPQGYNTGYNSGYTGTNTEAGGYTPASLDRNLDKFLAMQTGYGNSSSYDMQNNQSAKQEFLNKNGLGGNYQWNPDYSIWKGTIISIVLDTGINTDLPGQVMGHVTKNIYSSQDGRYLLIPQGSRVFGEYNSSVSYGQNRVQVVWNTLIRPDGLEIYLGSMNGIDPYGVSGYKGWKSEHPFEYLKAFGLIAAYSVLDTKAMNLIDTQGNTYAQNAMTDVYSETKKLNNKIVDRTLDIQPTIRIASGTEVNLITNVTIDLPPLEPYEVEQKYVRY